jgi:putative monooxygenase
MSDSRNPAAPAILRPAALPAADRGGGNRTIPLVTRATGTRQMLNGITVIAPGSAIALHTHNCEETVIVIAGRALAEIDGATHELGVHDTTWIPEGLPHRFRNPSPSEELRIFWTYASVDATRTLVETGETRPVSAEHATLA